MADYGSTNIVTVIGGEDSGADKVFAINGTGKELVKGDKVLLNLFENTEEFTTTPFKNSYTDNTRPIYVLENKDIWFCNYSSRLTRYVLKGNSVVSTEFRDVGTEDPRNPAINWGGLVTFRYVSDAITIIYDYNLDCVNLTRDTTYPLSEEYVIDGVTGILTNKANQTYDTGLGAVAGTQKKAQIFGNTLVMYVSETTIKHIDLTNFPNCTEKVYSFQTKPNRVFGFTGKEVGSYCVTWIDTNAIILYKFTGSGYIIEDIISTLRDSNVYVDLKNKIICYFDVDKLPKVLMYNKSSDRFVEQEIPSHIREKVYEYALNTQRGNGTLYLATNSSMTAYGLSYSDGQYDGKFVAIYPTDYNTYVLKESDSKYYNNDTSYTAYATGNIDSEGRYEVETILPDTVDVTLTVNPDVTDDEFKVIKVDVQ